MRLLGQLLLTLFTLFPSFSFAAQDDARVILRKPTFLFGDNEEGQLRFLNAFAARGGFGSYFSTDEDHAWRYGTGFDTALITVGKNGLWRFGVNFDGVADADNSIGFRLVQSHYEVFSSYEFRLDESVFYIGYRHRCRHALDNADSRIIMKTGPEIGYNGEFQLGEFNFVFASSLLAYLYGQNDDLMHQHRLNLSGSIQADYSFNNTIGAFAALGVSAIWVGQSNHREYLLFGPTIRNELLLSPAVSMGVKFDGMKGDLKIYGSYDTILDSGFHEMAKQIHVASINGEFMF